MTGVRDRSGAPAVSVVIPLYNKRPHIARAVTSVFAQTVRDVEVIVVDDGSTDGGAEVVRGFDRVRLIRQENRGVSAARNRGIAAARGELVAFLDADDEWMPGHLEALVRLRERYPCAGAYGTAYLVKKEGTSRIPPFGSVIPREPWEGLLPNYFRAATAGALPLSSSGAAVPRHVLCEMGGFATGAWYGEDTDLWGRIALKYPIAFTWSGMAVYHKEASNRACNTKKPVGEPPFVASAQKALQAGEVPPGLQEDVREHVASRQIIAACRNLEAGRPDLARAILRGCRTRDLWKSRYWFLFWSYVPAGAYRVLRPRRVFTALNAWKGRASS
ncbi:glycosyltransferase family 2 protein [Methanoculleus sp.]|uniref:glycosyltransferase family 2 protein n=1 Tax=Methanoculleus sp. TaxID=90427 RepID=UPI0025D73583|nr:glycosyltransferase family 2 protein [Methanoculleus sp.]